MQAKYFERELICEFREDGELERFQRMTFTVDELRGIAVMLAAGMGVVGYTFTSKTITEQFQDAWAETSGYGQN